MQSTHPITLFPGEISLENLDDLFAFHRARFGGATMELEEGGDEPEEAPADTEEQVAEEGSEEESEESGDEENPPGEGDDASDSKLSHDDALAALAKVRKSEAKTRTKLRELEEKLKDAKTSDEVKAITEELSATNAAESRALLVENVALKAGLPAELADALKGETREELEAHAKVLAKFAPKDEAPSDDPDLSGGLEPGSNSDAFDPKAIARRVRQQRNRGR